MCLHKLPPHTIPENPVTTVSPFPSDVATTTISTSQAETKAEATPTTENRLLHLPALQKHLLLLLLLLLVIEVESLSQIIEKIM